MTTIQIYCLIFLVAVSIWVCVLMCRIIRQIGIAKERMREIESIDRKIREIENRALKIEK